MVDSMKDIIEAQMEDPIVDSKWRWKETASGRPQMVDTKWIELADEYDQLRDEIKRRKVRRIILVFLLFVIGIAFGYFWHYTATANASSYIAQVERNPKVLAAMKYHGIRFCTEKNGRITFHRNGQTCQLYTQTFEKHWRNK